MRGLVGHRRSHQYLRCLEEVAGQPDPRHRDRRPEALSHPQTRAQFDQVVWQTLRSDLLMQAGINPMSPAQIQVIEAAFRGTDYVVKYVPR